MTSEQLSAILKMKNEWGASIRAMALALEISEDQVIGAVGTSTTGFDGRTALINCLRNENQNLVLFWELYRQAYRLNSSPISFGLSFEQFKIITGNASVSFDACVELREFIDAAFAGIRTCGLCNVNYISTPCLGFAQCPCHRTVHTMNSPFH